LRAEGQDGAERLGDGLDDRQPEAEPVPVTRLVRAEPLEGLERPVNGADRHPTAVKDGWLPAGPEGAWIINSIGVIRHAGQPLLIAVLSSGQPSESSGIRQVQAAALAAADAIG
jgi:hypothetical protein